MASPVQAIGGGTNFNSLTSVISFVALPAAGDGVVVICLTGVGEDFVDTVVDNQTGNVFKRVFGSCQFAEYWFCESINAPTGTYTVTVTYGSLISKQFCGMVELPPGYYPDQPGSAGFLNSVNPVSAATAVAMGKDNSTSDIVLAAMMSPDNGPHGFTTPAGCTNINIQDVSGQPCYSMCYYGSSSNSAPDSVAWSWAGGATDIASATLMSFSQTPNNQPRIVNISRDFYGSVTMPAVQAGNSLFVSAVLGSGGGSVFPTGVSDGSAYTSLVSAANGTTIGSSIWGLFNASAGSHSIVVSMSGSPGSVMQAYEVANVTGMDATAANTGTGTAMSATTPTLASANELALAAFGAAFYTANTPDPAWVGTLAGSGTGGLAQMDPAPNFGALSPQATTPLSPSFGSTPSEPWAGVIVTLNGIPFVPVSYSLSSDEYF